MAVTLALWSLGIVVVVALKVPVVAPAATVTDAGTVGVELLSLFVTVAPPADAAAVKVTVQVEVAEFPDEFGEQVSDETMGRVVPPVTVPAVVTMGSAFPAAEDAKLFVTPIGVLMAPAAMVKFTTATVPFAMVPELRPDARQV